jgi:tRNA A-37 threonylcarbamoyl transferase component Bud32
LSHVTWSGDGVRVTARHDVADAVRAALNETGSLYRWAARQPARAVFHGRAEAYGVLLGPVRAVVRHAHRGGRVAPLLGDRYMGRARFLREIRMAETLRAAGVRTPAVLAGVRYDAFPFHRADVATERVDARDLADVFFGPGAPPDDATRQGLWTGVGRLVRRLHDAGFVHPDLQLKNVLTDGAEAWLLDVDTCRQARSAADRRANLARFDRSWDKWQRRAGPRLTVADRAAFTAGYGGAA